MSDADIDSDSSSSPTQPPTLSSSTPFNPSQTPPSFLRTLLVLIIKTPGSTNHPPLNEFKHIAISDIEDETIIELIEVLLEGEMGDIIRDLWTQLERIDREKLNDFSMEREELESVLDGVEEGEGEHECAYVLLKGEMAEDRCYPIIEAYETVLKSITSRIKDENSNDNLRSNALGILHEILYTLSLPLSSSSSSINSAQEGIIIQAFKNGNLYESSDILAVKIWNSFDELEEQKNLIGIREVSELVGWLNVGLGKSKEGEAGGNGKFGEELERFCQDEGENLWVEEEEES